MPSVCSWRSRLIFGVNYRAAQLPFVLLAAVLSVLAYGIALRYWGVPESFAPFAVFGALALYWACAEAKWKWLAPGACAGLAHLSRADGLNDVLTWERGRQVTRQQGLHSLAWEDELT